MRGGDNNNTNFGKNHIVVYLMFLYTKKACGAERYFELAVMCTEFMTASKQATIFCQSRNTNIVYTQIRRYVDINITNKIFVTEADVEFQTISAW